LAGWAKLNSGSLLHPEGGRARLQLQEGGLAGDRPPSSR
jgi:hypothetical protein